MRATPRNHTNPKAHGKLHQIIYLDIDKSSKTATKAQTGAENLQQPFEHLQSFKTKKAPAEGSIANISGTSLVDSRQAGSRRPRGRGSEGQVDERSRVLTLVLWTPLDERGAQVDQLLGRQRRGEPPRTP